MIIFLNIESNIIPPHKGSDKQSVDPHYNMSLYIILFFV